MNYCYYARLRRLINLRWSAGSESEIKSGFHYCCQFPYLSSAATNRYGNLNLNSLLKPWQWQPASQRASERHTDSLETSLARQRIVAIISLASLPSLLTNLGNLFCQQQPTDQLEIAPFHFALLFEWSNSNSNPNNNNMAANVAHRCATWRTKVNLARNARRSLVNAETRTRIDWNQIETFKIRGAKLDE